MSPNTNTTSVLNSLIEMHYDRIEGYTLASKILKEHDADLLHTFQTCCDDSRQYIATLADHIWQLGGKTTNKTSFTGKLYRTFMNLRGSLTLNNKVAITSMCLFGEYALQKAYETAQYRKDEISDEASKLIEDQQAALRRNYQHQRDHYHMPALVG